MERAVCASRPPGTRWPAAYTPGARRTRRDADRSAGTAGFETGVRRHAGEGALCALVLFGRIALQDSACEMANAARKPTTVITPIHMWASSNASGIMVSAIIASIAPAASAVIAAIASPETPPSRP